MKNRSDRFTTLLLAIVCFVVLPVAQAARPRGEDRGNDNSAAENVDALNLSTTGSNNTAHGWFSLFSNTTGSSNTADGFQALYSNTTGNNNVANGFSALVSNITGSGNTATGRGALFANTSAFSNTAIGAQALTSNTTGGENSALGANAGFDVTTASNVICIGSLGANVSNSTWIENIYGITTQSGTTAQVIVSDSGQLGTAASAERFKKDIADMDKASEVILSLRPVTFHYKTDLKSTPQFGLIAEEVAKVNPALVLPDKEGKPYSVRYDQVNAMLLNEFLKEHRTVQELKKEIAALTATVKEQAIQIQKVSVPLELSKSAPQTVLNGQQKIRTRCPMS